MNDIDYFKRFCYPDLPDNKILEKIESVNRFEEQRKEFLKHIIFRTKKSKNGAA